MSSWAWRREFREGLVRPRNSLPDGLGSQLFGLVYRPLFEAGDRHLMYRQIQDEVTDGNS